MPESTIAYNETEADKRFRAWQEAIQGLAVQHEFVIGIEPFTVHIAYTAGGDPEYVGKAAPDSATSAAAWQIFRMTWAGGNLTAIQWADGNTEFDNVWDDRTTLNYS